MYTIFPSNHRSESLTLIASIITSKMQPDKRYWQETGIRHSIMEQCKKRTYRPSAMSEPGGNMEVERMIWLITIKLFSSFRRPHQMQLTPLHLPMPMIINHRDQ